MSLRKIVLAAFVALIVTGTLLYAQSEVNLGTGIYRTVGAETNLVQVKARSGSSVRDITILSPDGSVVSMKATGTWRNGKFEVDFGRDGFDIWIIVSNREFIDGTGKTWHWVRHSL